MKFQIPNVNLGIWNFILVISIRYFLGSKTASTT
ncbi:hypothetical protein SAMN06265220_1011351 [Flavobacterium nitrogenifigens]|uniref:Uncharacterized protein n=1 Tax=Flavobacterium nitrogenifigens TaxID=1617283 RepID=A0A521BSF5_9FLAO|nr:hypothetical protein SAMN06265220_1011351 [Flavobacterium nitrogenifigens]